MNPDWLGDQIRRNVRLLKSVRGVTDENLAKSGGFTSRQIVSARMSGRTEIAAEDIARLAAGLRVEPHVLLLRTDEALRWVEENPDYKPARYRKQRPAVDKARPPRGGPATATA